MGGWLGGWEKVGRNRMGGWVGGWVGDLCFTWRRRETGSEKTK